MTKNRYSDAIAISDGACNVSGIALTLVEACREVRACNGHIESDPAILLMVSQIAYLVGLWDGISDWQLATWTFDMAREACRTANAQESTQEARAL